MKRWLLAAVLPLLSASWVMVAESPAGKTHQVRLNGHTFTLPAGFDIEVAAKSPLVDRPIAADFDEQGRLYVADSSGSSEKVDVQLKKKPHRIVRLEDTKGTGRFDKSGVFADQMMFPEGVLWHDGCLYVAAPPSIWRLTDTKNSGKADFRIEWFEGKTLTGCANDLHGPYRGPDGLIYWCKGAFAKQEYPRPHKKPLVTRAAHIFRAHSSGFGIEPVMTGGMDNPIHVVFTPGGERIFTTTFFQHPGGGKRDGLIHAIYGGVYGKDHDPVYEHPWTGPSLMPVLTHMGPAAPCGLLRYESSIFGPEYKDNLFACQFNMHKVSRHILKPDGATFQCRDEDFLVSDNVDFHPTGVIEDADGSLLVLDTGGWYKLCCPTSQLVKPDVLGAIYRIRKKDAPRVDDPRGLKLNWAKMSAKELANLLDDPRPAVRRRAIELLPSKEQAAFKELTEVVKGNGSGEAKRNAVWCATRLYFADAPVIVFPALSDKDPDVRHAAAHCLAIRRYPPKELIDLLRKGTPADQRVAAEVLGRCDDKRVVPVLLEAIAGIKEPPGSASERVLEHSLIYALIELGDREGTAAGLKSKEPRVRKAAMIALDQMDGGGLDAATVAKELSATDPALKEAASWIVSRHPDWGTALAGHFRDRLTAKSLPAAEQDELTRQLAKLSRADAVQGLLGDALVGSGDSQRVALRAMAQSGLKQVPNAWTAGLVQLLEGKDAALVREAAATARALQWGKQRPEKLAAALLKIGTNSDQPAEVRLTALASVPGGLAEVPPPLLAFLRSKLDREQPVMVRTLAADILARGKLVNDQLVTLAGSFKDVGPMEMDRLLQSFEQSQADTVGLALVAALKTAPARTGLVVGTLKRRLAKYGPAVQKEAESLYAALDADAVQQKAKLEKMLAALKDGDIRRGQAVFNGAKAACASCHAIGYLGGKVGPDLTRIGQIRTERDLLESIVFPSASFVQGFEPVVVTTKEGKSYNGLLRKDTPDEVLLVMGANQEVRIPRADIDEMLPSKVSVMPAGLDQQLTPQELADLVAFLRACK
jgi:putative membrane-bound dehydrogenase-like protein